MRYPYFQLKYYIHHRFKSEYFEYSVISKVGHLIAYLKRDIWIGGAAFVFGRNTFRTFILFILIYMKHAYVYKPKCNIDLFL